ncbi:uncharacterized protein LOC127736525 [Mytilus californianus]|uniref:uncharacterized protein LOC127736525 n=1 Tax=Mytilus californianus TaxID=6549 RepID=UPI002247A4A0|nr:uncharacterized protein LOC127736525 [Mytilus californianus]
MRLSALPSAQSPNTLELNKKQKHAKVMRERRAKWNEQQKQENKERSRIRMQNMRERKKKRTYSKVLKPAHDNLKGKTKTDKMARKKFVSNLSDHIKRKYGMQSLVCKTFGIEKRYLTKYCKNTEQKQRKDTISKDTTDSANKFLVREDISINVPNIKAMKANTEDHQFVLQKSTTEIYSDWMAENQNTVIKI